MAGRARAQRPCGMATPWPRPVLPSRSREHSDSYTERSVSPPVPAVSTVANCSSRRFLPGAARSTRTRAGLSRSSRCMASAEVVRTGGGAGAMVGHLFLLLDHQAVELVGQQIEGGVHVRCDAIAGRGLAGGGKGGCGHVRELVQRMDHAGLAMGVVVGRDAGKLGLNVVAQGGGHFDMMAVNVDPHVTFLLLGSDH